MRMPWGHGAREQDGDRVSPLGRGDLQGQWACWICRFKGVFTIKIYSILATTDGQVIKSSISDPLYRLVTESKWHLIWEWEMSSCSRIGLRRIICSALIIRTSVIITMRRNSTIASSKSPVRLWQHICHSPSHCNPPRLRHPWICHHRLGPVNCIPGHC